MSNKDASVKQLYDKDYNLIYPILHLTEEATVSKYDGSISDSRFKDIAFGYGVGRFVKLDDDDYPILRADDKFKDQLKAFKNNDTKNYYRINIFSDALGNLCGFIPGDFSSGGGGSGDTPGGEGSDSAGQEFIFARSNDGKAPLIEYDINSKEYQEDNYVPNDWSDHPQGIDSSEYRYEFVSTRKKENNEWGDFSDPAIWAKWGEDGKDGDGVEYVYILTNSNDNPGLIIPDDWEDSDSSYQTSEYKPDSNIKDADGNVLKWTDNYNQPNAYARYSWVAIRKYNSGFWEEFSEPKLWNIYKVAGKSAVDVYRRSDMILDESSLPKYNDGSILYYQFSTDKFFNEDDVEITEIGSGDNMWHHDPPSSSYDASLKYLYRSSAMVDIIDMETPVEITEDMWKGPLFESANGDKGERGTSISVTGRFDSSATLKKAYEYYLISNDILSGEMPDKPSQYFKDDKLSISDGYITANDGNLWLYSAENIGYSEFDEFFDNNWTNLGKIQGDSAYLYTAYGYRDSNGDIHFTKDEQGTAPFGTIEGPLFGVHTTSTKYEDVFPNSDDQVNLFTWSKWRGEDGYGYEQIFILHDKLIDYTDENEPLKIPQYEDFASESEDGTIEYKYTLAEWNTRDFVPDASGLAEGTFWSDTPFSPSFDLPYCYTAIRKVPGIDDENIPNEFHGSFDGVEYSNKPILFSSLSEAKSIYHIELSNEFDQIYVNDQNKVEYEQVFNIDCDIYKDQDIINDEIIDASVILNNIVENTICDISIRRDDATSTFEGFTLTFKKDATIDLESLIFNIKVDVNNDFSLSNNFKLIRYSSTTDYDLWVSNSVIHLVFGEDGWGPSSEYIEWGIKAKTVGVISEVKNLENIPDDCSVQILKSGRTETISSGMPIRALDVSDIKKSGNVITIELIRNGIVFDYINIECVSDGTAGPQGLGEERIYTLTQDSSAPAVPKGAGSAYTTDEWNAARFVPDSWSFIPPSPDASNPYCWYAVRQTPTDNPTEYNEFKGTTTGDKEYAILNNIYNESVANSQYSLELSNEFEQVFVDGEYRVIKSTLTYQTFETTLSLFKDGNQINLGEELEFGDENAISNLTVTFTGASEKANSLLMKPGGLVSGPGISNSSKDYGKLLTWDDNYNAAYIAILSNSGGFVSDVNTIKGLENIRFKICFGTLKLNKSTNSILFTLTLKSGEKLEKRLDLISIASDTDYDLNVSPTYIHKTSDGLYVPSEIDVKIESRNIINDSATKILNTIPKGYSIRHKFGQNGTINTQSGSSTGTKIDTIKIDSDDTVIIELLKGTSVIDHVEVQVIKDGQDGVVPDISEIKAPILYPAGIWNSETTYEKTIDTVPYVYHKSDNNQDNGNYYILNSSTSTNNEPDFQQNDIEYWKIMDKYESIYTEIGIIENGTIGEAVFNNDFMFSQTGIYNTDYSISLYKRSSTAPVLSNRNLTVDELKSDGWTEEVPTGDTSLYIISAIKGTTTNTAEGIIGTEWKGLYTEDNISEFNNSRFDSSEYQLFNNKDPYGENGISEKNKWKPAYCVDLQKGTLWCGAGNVKFSDDGSGELAGGKISWDAAGNLYFPITGTMQASYKYTDLEILGLSYSLSLNGGHFGAENDVILKAYDVDRNELCDASLHVMSPSTVVGTLDVKNATSLILYYQNEIIAKVDNIEIPKITVLKHNIIIYDSSNYLTANCIGCQNGVLYINDDGIYEIAPNGSKDYIELSTEITNTNNAMLSDVSISGQNCTVYDTSLKILGNSSKIIKTKILKNNKSSSLIVNYKSTPLMADIDIENEHTDHIDIDIKQLYNVEKLKNNSWRIYISIKNIYSGTPEDAEYWINLYNEDGYGLAYSTVLLGGDEMSYIDVNSKYYSDNNNKFLLTVTKN